MLYISLILNCVGILEFIGEYYTGSRGIPLAIVLFCRMQATELAAG